jgi:hypothetical protein
MVVFQSSNVDVVAMVGVLSPAEIDILCVRIVEFVVGFDRPLDVDPAGVGATEAIVECDFESSGIEKVV